MLNPAVMAGRVESPDSLDFFPTPPWATRALCEHVLFDRRGSGQSWWRYSEHLHGIGFGNGPPPSNPPFMELSAAEPACGEGHMAAVLAEYFGSVDASDIHDYGFGRVEDFLRPETLFEASRLPAVDWVITNPPFARALEFLTRLFALNEARRVRKGWALLLRTSWLESIDRWPVFRDRPPTLVCPFVERVPMHKGRWDPAGSTATAYCWFVWAPALAHDPGPPRLVHIPPGCRERLTRPDDAARFTAVAAAPLLDGVRP